MVRNLSVLSFNSVEKNIRISQLKNIVVHGVILALAPPSYRMGSFVVLTEIIPQSKRDERHGDTGCCGTRPDSKTVGFVQRSSLPPATIYSS